MGAGHVFQSQTQTFENSVGVGGKVEVTVGPDMDKNVEAGVFPQFRNRPPVSDSLSFNSRHLVLPPVRGIRTVLISSAASFAPDGNVQNEAFALLKNASASQKIYEDLHLQHTA